jgi:diguanylate cyclase (GGDEF)-like protein
MINSLPVLSAPLILLVEDDKTTRLVMRAHIENQGYLVLESSDGEECLQTCRQFKPDMILLDGIMPKLDGFSCCEQLHEILEDDCPPIVMITCLNDEQSVEKAFAVGATDYVTKPIHWPVLLQRVKRVLQTRWVMSELKKQIEREKLLKQELEVVNLKLRKLALIDELTQIANRRSFDRYLQREWNRMAREKTPLSLLLCDVDYFKSYNDIYGHPAGDRCLQQIASILKHSAKRPADFVARYGGEEFAAILPRTIPQGAVKIAEQIRQQVKHMHLLHAGSFVSNVVTLSIGVASVIPVAGTLSLQILIDEADKALYEAKSQGRDRVVLRQFTLS